MKNKKMKEHSENDKRFFKALAKSIWEEKAQKIGVLDTIDYFNKIEKQRKK